MTIHITCACGKELHAPDEFAGRQTRCPACARTVVLPAASQAIQPVLTAQPQMDVGPEMGRPSAGVATSTSGKAIFALILGCLGFCLPVLASVPAIILGFMGLSAVKQSGGRVGGRGLALAGVILGFVTMALILPYAGFGYASYRMITAGRDAASRIDSTNNLKQIGLAMHVYADDNNSNLPTDGPEGKRLLSWRVMILPYFGTGSPEARLYKRFNLNEPWDGPTNKPLLAEMPAVYLDRRFQSPDDAKTGLTYYRGFTGPDTVLGGGQPVNLGILTSLRGTSNTLLVVEAGDPVPWTKPEDTSFDENSAFGGPKRGDYIGLYADGHTSYIRAGTSRKIINGVIHYTSTDTNPPP